ncbi:GCD14-domain-containing protein [Tuber magnatum]|uniref:tRNA (adenine(58)-N(1))-methyltransferase catalytic subunit TRM61 n=1 Tax=Tuber magnatum TaxID=42249 RepID=A0A317SR14_9PEZI|nr:GCD14-domain-containing protein [Tuber magnatum]
MSEVPEPEMAPASNPLPSPSAFLHTPESIPYSSSPSIIHLKRDLLVPLSFQSNKDQPETHDTRAAAYSSKGVLNTRFGDFPHSSIVGIPYGSQVLAAPLTNNEWNRKRKRREDPSEGATAEPKSTGFLHVLAPTAELWTASLPHRTQVVYTPDSSFILHKLQVRPGSVLIEAGAGSGSFTHAGVRAVYNGYPDGRSGIGKEGRKGKVFSFEFHKERVQKLIDEVERHRLDGLVEIVHRDVCKDGFLVTKMVGEQEEEGISPRATAVFLDLPAPWLALPHLTRRTRPTPSLPTSTGLTPSPSPGPTVAEDGSVTISNDKASNEPYDSGKPSALSSTEAVRICTFSPCIEQVTRTVSVLRKLGWVDIEMVEVQHRRIEVRRLNPKGYENGAGPRTVAEAVQRLKWVGEYREHKRERDSADSTATTVKQSPTEAWRTQNSREKEGAKDGKIITRTEPEIKSHTSYLVFAVLPREWTAEDEATAQALVEQTTKSVVNAPVDGNLKGNGKLKWKGEKEEKPMSKRQIKRAEREKRKTEEGKVEGDEAIEDEMIEGESAPPGNEEEGKDIPSAEGGNYKMEVDG